MSTQKNDCNLKDEKEVQEVPPPVVVEREYEPPKVVKKRKLNNGQAEVIKISEESEIIEEIKENSPDPEILEGKYPE